MRCYNDRTFMLTPSASSTDVTAGKDNVFQVCFTDPNQGVGAADYMAENFAGAKVAVIYRNDDAYSQGIRDTFVKEATDKGAFEVVYQGTFTNDTASDFSVQLAGAQNAGADLVFLPIYYQPASIIFSQAKAMGYAPTFFGVDGMDGILTMPGFDASLAEGRDAHDPVLADAPMKPTRRSLTLTLPLMATEPNQFAADAYDGVYIVKAALEAAGCTADMSNEEICDALVSAMTSLKFTGLTGTDMTWNAEGRGLQGSDRLCRQGRPVRQGLNSESAKSCDLSQRRGCRERKLPAAYAPVSDGGNEGRCFPASALVSATDEP